MAESREEYSDGCSVDSYEDFESPSPSSSSEESANEAEPNASSISGPSRWKKRKNDSQPRSTGEVIHKKTKEEQEAKW